VSWITWREDKMTVGDIRKYIENLPDDAVIGIVDEDDDYYENIWCDVIVIGSSVICAPRGVEHFYYGSLQQYEDDGTSIPSDSKLALGIYHDV